MNELFGACFPLSRRFVPSWQLEETLRSIVIVDFGRLFQILDATPLALCHKVP